MDDNDKTQELVSRGAELTGAAAGGAIGFFTGGPIGAAVGGAAGPFITWSLQKLGKDFANRVLSSREEVKVGAGLIFAYTRIDQYLKQGRIPRNDNFFEYDTSGWSASDEILEGVLLKCKNEHEEKKLRYVSNIYANVAFMPDVSVAGANWLLQKVQDLTYRQLWILSIIERQDTPHSKGPSYGPSDGDPAFELEYERISDMLTRRETIEELYYGHYNSVGEATPVTGLTRVGKFCYIVMGLSEIQEGDLRKLASRFPRAFEA